MPKKSAIGSETCLLLGLGLLVVILLANVVFVSAHAEKERAIFNTWSFRDENVTMMSYVVWVPPGSILRSSLALPAAMPFGTPAHLTDPGDEVEMFVVEGGEAQALTQGGLPSHIFQHETLRNLPSGHTIELRRPEPPADLPLVRDCGPNGEAGNGCLYSTRVRCVPITQPLCNGIAIEIALVARTNASSYAHLLGHVDEFTYGGITNRFAQNALIDNHVLDPATVDLQPWFLGGAAGAAALAGVGAILWVTASRRVAPAPPTLTGSAEDLLRLTDQAGSYLRALERVLVATGALLLLAGLGLRLALDRWLEELRSIWPDAAWAQVIVVGVTLAYVAALGLWFRHYRSVRSERLRWNAIAGAPPSPLE